MASLGPILLTAFIIFAALTWRERQTRRTGEELRRFIEHMDKEG